VVTGGLSEVVQDKVHGHTVLFLGGGVVFLRAEDTVTAEIGHPGQYLGGTDEDHR
ncbi:MAG: hypothetical protein H5T80_15345, partial [Dietzia sp.]|nr:hypothetical protein [Dietzia sp.]